MNFDVFISYAHQDKAAADAACAKIEADGIRCWIAPRDVPPGAEWAGAIIKAIDNCRVMVLIFSSSTNGSRQIDREAQRAFDKEKSVIPFRIEDVAPQQSLAYYLGPVHWLDALTPPLDQHLQKLSTSIKAFVQADKPSDDKEPLALQKTEARQESEAKRRADEETQRKKDVAEAQRIAEEQGQQQAEAERLAQEEKGRIRVAEEQRQRKSPGQLPGRIKLASVLSNVRLVFSNSLNFSGRSGRSEYWYWVGFIVTGTMVVGFLDPTLLGGAFILVTLLPSLAVAVRRLHDTDRTGWWVLLWFYRPRHLRAALLGILQRHTGSEPVWPNPVATD